METQPLKVPPTNGFGNMSYSKAGIFNYTNSVLH